MRALEESTEGELHGMLCGNDLDSNGGKFRNIGRKGRQKEDVSLSKVGAFIRIICQSREK